MIIETEAYERDGTIIIDRNGHVWQACEPSSIIDKLRLAITPGKRAIILLKSRDGRTHRVHAIRIATSYVVMSQ